MRTPEHLGASIDPDGSPLNAGWTGLDPTGASDGFDPWEGGSSVDPWESGSEG